jgi:hypothetical protein
MAGPASQQPTASPNPRSTANGTAGVDYINGHAGLSDSPASASTPQIPASKKAKGKKAADPSETGKLLAAKINQLELDAAGDKEQELEIGGCFPLYNFSQIPLCHKMAFSSSIPHSPNLQLRPHIGTILPTNYSNFCARC